MTECVARGQPWHKTCGRRGTAQHVPKRSQGGKTIVAYLCPPIHDAIDNGLRLDGLRLKNRVVMGAYFIENRETGEILLETPVTGEDHTEAADTGGKEPTSNLVNGKGGPVGPSPSPSMSIASMNGVKFGPTTLTLPPKMLLSDLLAVLELLSGVEQGRQWWWGDALSYFEDGYEEFSQHIDDLGVTPEAISNWIWVARSVPPSERRGELSWTLHRSAAKLPATERGEALQKAVDGQLTTREFTALLRGDEQVETRRCPTCGKVMS